MDAIVGKVQSHLKTVSTTPSIPLDQRLISELDSNLCSNLNTSSAIQLVSQIAGLLPIIQEDPTPVVGLLERIAENASIPFVQLANIQPSLPLLEGLSTRFLALNLATLALLQTAQTEAEIGIIAGRPELVEALVNLWLRSEDIGVSLKAWRVIALFLGAKVDSTSVSHMRCVETAHIETNLMWRRLTTDKNVYGMLYALTSLKTVGQPGQPTRRAKGISQFRLMDLIVTFSHVQDLWRSHIPEIEQLYGVEPQEGLINYALVHMVDDKDDILERLQLLQYYTEFLVRTTTTEIVPGGSSRNLEYLMSNKIHEGILDQFINPTQDDPMTSLLSSSIVSYIQGYVSFYPDHFLQDSTHTKTQILEHTSNVLQSMRANHWAQNNEPTGLLGLLSSLPRSSILPVADLRSSPILDLPLHPPNQHIITCLARIFSGQTAQSQTNTSSAPASASLHQQIEAVSARALFLLYLGKNPNFFESIISCASLLSIPGTAQAALDMLLSLITAKWKREVSEPSNDSQTNNNDHAIPGQEVLQRNCSYYGTLPLPKDGLSALLLPPAITYVVPFLLSSSEHLAGGRGGDTSYIIAQKKFDVITAFTRGVRTMAENSQQNQLQNGTSQEQSLEPLIAALEARLKNGVLGKGVGVSQEHASEDVVHSVATMSR